ncbi:Ig-like domain-containing protein [Bacillus mycoides]|uniref:Ig-like domain-containing protein n=1 Tax=Bacillus mycoides TaxID=1405 RepID=UPI0038179EE9
MESLPNLTETEKEAFKKDVDSAKDKQQVKDIRDKADTKDAENKDKIAPNAPTIDDYARGVAKDASKVAIYVDGKFVRTAGVNEDGTYVIYTGDVVALQKEGAVFEIAARDVQGTESEKTKVTVLGVAPQR